MDGLDTKWCRKITEHFNRLSRVHERYRQTTDRRTVHSAGPRGRFPCGRFPRGRFPRGRFPRSPHLSYPFSPALPLQVGTGTRMRSKGVDSTDTVKRTERSDQ